MITHHQRDIDGYAATYCTPGDFEATQISYRRQAVLRSVEARAPGSVLEVGPGPFPIYAYYELSNDSRETRWVLVEPAHVYAEKARGMAAVRRNVDVVESLVEDAANILLERYGTFDMLICSSLLHEVVDPNALLRALVKMMDEKSVLHVNVPNAQSLHRRLAKAMGLIGNLTDASERNTQLQQHRVYSTNSLRADLEGVGLHVIRHGGIFLKPFTHAQMTIVEKSFGCNVLDGLAELGRELPELASEIFVDVQLAR